MRYVPAKETPLCQMIRKQLGLVMHRSKHEISTLPPHVGRVSVAPRITLHNCHRPGERIAYKIVG